MEPKRSAQNEAALPGPEGVTVDVEWMDLGSVPALTADNFLLQIDDQALIHLTVGQAVVPYLAGLSPEQVKSRVLEGTVTVRVRPATRLVLTDTRAAQLRDLLERILTMRAQQVAAMAKRPKAS